jgi:hypothetical protein
MEAAVADSDDDEDGAEIDPTGGSGSGSTGQRSRRASDVIDPDDDEDGGEDGDGDTGDESDQDDKATGKPKPYTPPGEDEWRKVTSRADKERKLRGDRENTIKDLRAQVKQLSTATATDDQKKQTELETEIEGKYKPIAVRASARAAFMEAGLKDLTKERMTDLMRMVELDDITVDEDGTVLGLDEQVDAIKDRWPNLFSPPVVETTETGKRKPAPRVTVADKSTQQPKRQLSMGERIAAKQGEQV